MTTHVIGAEKGFRMRAILVVLALAFVGGVLVVQARSIWSTTPASHDAPVPVHVDPHRTRTTGGAAPQGARFPTPAPWQIARKR